MRRSVTVVVTLAVALSIVVSTLVIGIAAARAIDNRPMQLMFDASGGSSESGSLTNVTREVGAPTFWQGGYNGAGIDVALIDSGVAPVYGVDRPNKVIYGPDFSFEQDAPGRENLDTFGHGTHMAGIIAGRDSSFRGMAPAARIISLKAADALGRTNVGQVIGAIKWVTENHHANGMNIRVLNLSFGTNVVAPYELDDLAYAVEQAWKTGIVVVVSAGNQGSSVPSLSDPAFDPFVIAVGADNTRGTTDVADDNVTTFSSRGNGLRDPDLIAPGKSILSLRVPGSYLDESHPEARVGDAYFRGSGTSQAAAVVSGAAALLIQQRPGLSPDEVKAIFTSTAREIPLASHAAQGAGLLDLGAAYSAGVPSGSEQTWTPSVGGSGYAWADADTTGNSWSALQGNSWSAATWTGNSWSGADWEHDSYTTTGNSWSSDGWLGVSWGKKPKSRGGNG